MTKKFNFEKACKEMLVDLGAVESESYNFKIETIAGTLRMSPYPTWLAMRFDDVAAGKAAIRRGSYNPYSGKWNWHFNKPNAEDVQLLREQIEFLLPGAT